MKRDRNLKQYAWLSIATAILTIALKVAAYLFTGSVGLLSDALESGVNLAAAVLVLITLTIASQPPDEEHTYGHTKVEYFSCGAEGMLILIAAATIIVSAIRRLLAPQPIEALGIGILVSVVAAILNFIVARILLQVGRQHNSVTLIADAQHLFTDVWTSGGVVLGVGAVVLTGWNVLDPLIALAVAVQIIYAGIKLVQRSIHGLMDTSLPPAELAKVTEVLDQYQLSQGIQFHALRSRQSGAQRFVSVHIQVPGAWTVQSGHSLLEEIERDIRQKIPPVSVFTHLEPVEDPISWQDIQLDRLDS